MTSSTEKHAGTSRALVLAIFVIVTGLDAAVLYRTRDRHLGFHEEHFDNGVALYENGAMLSSGKPNVFRPPGYPVFVAMTLAVKDVALSVAAPLWNERPTSGRRIVVIAAHAVLLGVFAAALFWFAIDRTGPLIAGAVAVAVGANPFLLILAGHISYELLHLVLVAVATMVLLKQIGVGPPRPATLVGSGVLWGAATLVKSVTLVVPAFVLPWAWLQYGRREAMRVTLLFSAGLLLVVAPYTARNYLATGRLIVVNDGQAPFALWATSLERIPSDAGYLQWQTLWGARGMPAYTEITGKTIYKLSDFEQHSQELSERFAAMARENLRRDPTVYAYNAAHNAVMFIADSPVAPYFDRYAWPRQTAAFRWLAGLSFTLMTVVGAIATVLGCVRRDPRFTLILALFAMMCAAHALTYLEARYLYVKVPSIAAGFALACMAASQRDVTWRRGALGLAASAAVLSMAGLFVL